MARTNLTKRQLRFPLSDKNRDTGLLAKLNEHDAALDSLEIPLQYVGTVGTAAGSVTLTGAIIGQNVLSVLDFATTAGSIAVATGSFESTISVTDAIQQSSMTNTHAGDKVLVTLKTPA